MAKLTNLLGLAALIGAFNYKANRALIRAQQMPHACIFHNYSRPNQRRHRNQMRRSVFANADISRLSAGWAGYLIFNLFERTINHGKNNDNY